MNSLHNPVPHKDGSAAAAQAVPHSGYRQGRRHLVSGRINLAFVEVTAFQLQGQSKAVTEQLTVIPSERLPSYSIKCPKISFIFYSQLKVECARTLGLLWYERVLFSCFNLGRRLALVFSF